MRCPLLAFAFATALSAQTPKFTIWVHTGHGQVGYDVNSTMISGEKDMLVIDPQFSLSEAHKLAAEILVSKKNLTTIYVTHPHSDHLFGLAVLHQAFPAAKMVALPATVAGAKTGWPARQKFWFPTYGNNIPGPDPVLPDELAEPYLTLEGQRFPVTGPVQGADSSGNSFVCIPSLKAVVIPGHQGGGATDDMSAIAFMKQYIADWDKNVPASHSAAEMKAKVLAQYPSSRSMIESQPTSPRPTKETEIATTERHPNA